jgi:hypothetical protein
LGSLLSKHARCRGYRGCRDARGQNIASVGIHGANLPDRCYGVDCKGIVAVVTSSIITPHWMLGKREGTLPEGSG